MVMPVEASRHLVNVLLRRVSALVGCVVINVSIMARLLRSLEVVVCMLKMMSNGTGNWERAGSVFSYVIKIWVSNRDVQEEKGYLIQMMS